MVKYKIPIEFTVAYLAALSLLLGIEKLSLPVWAVFVTWAGYFVLGADESAFKTIYKCTPLGALFGLIAVIGFHYAINAMPSVHWVIPCMIVEFIVVLVLMVVISKFNFLGGAVFWAFASYFGTYYGGFYLKTQGFFSAAVVAMISSMIANFLGPVFGYLSIKLSMPMEE
ncbi:DUF1097 domain-containing protein [Thermococcus barophilus]|uniref:DUF1097 domain-containing protein n=1 Tax=Thermococcus barophilus TaxID=55802 RepID=A0A0S1XA39_THEBA|nr:DUF1097 domain-containing protein [Thermococcus barophilus]ALM74646.1 conserved membrane hypothetical protein [Thermococcus barophilus]